LKSARTSGRLTTSVSSCSGWSRSFLGQGVVVALLNSDVLWSPAIYLISILGAGITFGLFRWELKNILICNWLIHCAAALESHALREEHVGQYYRRPEPPGLFRRQSGESKEAEQNSGESNRTPSKSLSFRVRPFLVTSFGKTQAEKLVYSLAIFSWLALPGIVYASTSSDSRFAPLVWAVILTLVYVLLAIVLVILTLSALRAEVTERSPMPLADVKEPITLPVAAGLVVPREGK
jgi:hypothetical protein